MILSICIATYNRAEYIGETLDSLIPQINDDMEILIVDGASTDNTEEVAGRYALKEPRIRYIRLPEKGGVDQDFDKTVELARGEFCWLFTDDDIIRPGGIEAVLQGINEGHDLIIINAEVRNRDLSKTLRSQQMKLTCNKIYSNDKLDDIFIDSLPYLTFIGGVVIRRTIWLNRERKKFYGSEFIHIGVIFQTPLPGSTLIIAESYIVIRYGNAQWTPRHFDIWMIKWPEFIWSFINISEKAKSIVCSRKPLTLLRSLIWNRSLGYYSIQKYKQYYADSKTTVFFKLGALIIALIPRKIIIAIHFSYALYKGNEEIAFFNNHFSE